MRRLLLAALLLAPIAAATEPYAVLLDWQDGHTDAGAPLALDGVTSASFPLVVDACHRQLLVDLLYDPANATVEQEDVGSVSIPFTFRAELRSSSNATLASASIDRPGYTTAHLGEAPEGDYSVRLTLTRGAVVDWSLRVRGHVLPGEPECL